MIQEGETFDVGTLRPHFSPGPLSARAEAAVPVVRETAEQEITRLTWNVLDGSASLSDRQRLAELVKAQHAVRRRIDR
ncbi:MAG TPA: hypothetical protein VF175_12185 [Lacipirellula sp.]